MPIASSDLILRLSVKTGTAGDTTAGTPAGSLGKWVSTTVVSGAVLNNLFDDVSGAENAASAVDYRCAFWLNNHATLTLQAAKAYISAETAGGASVAIATDNVGVTAKGSATAQAAEIADETTAPTGVSAFSAPTTAATGLALGNIGPGQVAPFWVRRTAANSAALDNDGATWAVTGDTAA